ncbi:restriction endonuclease subunit S [Helicobacter sp. Faydin-H70]|uniref:Restriction endonuclease subunit S n=1 Tax=Helicobacter turcicus TaxID=2867412 RepID=A0ABS7JQ99_9HELI|nr:restriction endonuclease subunit S [Helicobacter turcicus]
MYPNKNTQFLNYTLEYKPLGEVCEIKRGKSITAKQVRQGKIPVIAGGQSPAYYHDEANRFGETIAVAGSGAYAGFISYWNEPIFLSDSFSVIPISDSLNIKFVFYFLKNKQDYIYSLKSGAGIPHIYPNTFQNFPIPLPPLEVQNAIVAILDKFDCLVNDLSKGIPAEIKARRQQYEYYREKLLSFKRLEKSEG